MEAARLALALNALLSNMHGTMYVPNKSSEPNVKNVLVPPIFSICVILMYL